MLLRNSCWFWPFWKLKFYAAYESSKCDRVGDSAFDNENELTSPGNTIIIISSVSTVESTLPFLRLYDDGSLSRFIRLQRLFNTRRDTKALLIVI